MRIFLLFSIWLLFEISVGVAQDNLAEPYELSAVSQKKLLVNTRAVANVFSNSAFLNGGINFGLERFLSDTNQQSLFTVNLSTSVSAFYPRISFSPINYSLNTNYRKKLLFKKNLFLLLNPSVGVNRTVEGDRTRLFPTARVGVGKGRIDRVTEKFVAETLIHQLSFAPEADMEIAGEIAKFIRELKNKRKYFNLGNIDEELALLSDYLIARGITNNQISEEVNVQLVDKIYKVLPSLDRTSGKEFGLTGVLGTRYTHFNEDKIFDLWRTFGQAGFILYYTDEKYINRKFQLNKSIGLSTIWLENYNSGYAITEHLSVEAIAFPHIDISYGLRAGVFNRFHTLQELRSYGIELVGQINKIYTQRCIVHVNVLANIDFSQNVNGSVAISLNI